MYMRSYGQSTGHTIKHKEILEMSLNRYNNVDVPWTLDDLDKSIDRSISGPPPAPISFYF